MALLRVTLYKAIGFILEHLPENIDMRLARVVARVIGRRGSPARINLANNLSRVLASAGAPVDAQLLDRFVDRGFAGYSRYWAESAKLPAIDPKIIHRRFTISEGLEYLDEAKERGAGVVLALPHIGSWEWGGAFLAQLGMPMTAIAEDLDPPSLFAWFKAKREAIGIRIEPLDEHAGAVMLSTLKNHQVVGLLCDRDIQDNGVAVDFFGEQVTLPGGPATLALRTGATLLVAACYSGPGPDHHAVVNPPITVEREGRLRDDVQRITQLIANDLEGLIRRAPEQWHVLQARFGTP